MVEVFACFPEFTALQKAQLSAHASLFVEWNKKINCVSRKDIDNLGINHILHSLALAKFISFKPYTHILDLGTGGGFPGIPLAIIFPQARFHLVDSIGKKIMVVKDLIEKLELKNATCTHGRIESLTGMYDFVISRAVAPASEIVAWTYNKISKDHHNEWRNGWILWKGGDVAAELQNTGRKWEIIELEKKFTQPYFIKKYIVHSGRK